MSASEASQVTEPEAHQVTEPEAHQVTEPEVHQVTEPEAHEYKDWNRVGGSLLGFWITMHFGVLLAASSLAVLLLALGVAIGAFRLPAPVARLAIIVGIALVLADFALLVGGLLGLALPLVGAVVLASLVMVTGVAAITRPAVTVAVRIGNHGVSHRG